MDSSCIFHRTLATVAKHLDRTGIRADWLGQTPANGVIEVEATTEFYRLWSALNFLFCMEDHSKHSIAPAGAPGDARGGGPVGGGTLLEFTDDEEFGHGFSIAGCMLIHLLAQRQRFELLDMSYHLLDVAKHESNSGA